MVNPYQNKDLSPSFLEKLFRDACQALSVQPPPRNGIIIKVNLLISSGEDFLVFVLLLLFLTFNGSYICPLYLVS